MNQKRLKRGPCQTKGLLRAVLFVLIALWATVVSGAPAQTVPDSTPVTQQPPSGHHGDHHKIQWIIAYALLLQSAAITLLIKSTCCRRKSDQLLRESEERFRMLAERSQTGIYIMDQDGSIRYVNQSMIEIFGYQLGEVIGKNFSSFFYDVDLPELVENLTNHTHGNSKPSHTEVRGLHRDGRTLDIELFAAISRSSGAPSIVGTVLDISARKETERRMQQQQRELELINHTLEQRIATEVEKSRERDRLMMQQSRFAAMGEMIGNIAHQWRQPLNMLGIVIQQLQMEQEKGQLTTEVLEQRVNKGMELLLYLSRTIDDFRNFFRPGIDPRPFSLSKAVAKTVNFLEPSCSDNGIKVTVEGKSSLMYTGHVNEFSQALLNILNNARDALLENGCHHPGIVVSLHDEGSRGVVTVRDNAGGIAPEVLDKIFDPYFTTKEEGKGTGVGLYMAKTIIERHMQGSICARNHQDGAEFKIIL